MYILKVLVEYANQSLDTTFDYLSNQYVETGCRVEISFRHRSIVGYVEMCSETSLTQDELEKSQGFKYQYIKSVIDQKPLLNKELLQLADYLAKLTLSPKIAVLQAMLPIQLKPNSTQGSGIRYEKYAVFKQDKLVKTVKQQEALAYMKEHKKVKVKDSPYSKAILDKLVEQTVIEYIQEEVKRNPFQDDIEMRQALKLSDDQQKVLFHISQKLGTYFTCLIHGVTGSGKTEVYLQLASQVIERQQSVLMMVPEIALTPMMVTAFKQRFGKKVAIIHSKLSSGERYDEYRRIEEGQVMVVVGARSAVFAPLKNIGLIIMDEEHDASYKQESTPRYLTSQVARKRALYHHCPLVLGSATPSLETYSRALKGVYDLCELPHRINQNPLPEVELIDMAQEIRKHNYSLFSSKMKTAIQSCLEKGEQVVLLLNKRGYASYMRCLDCGEVVKCPHCDVTLTYHKATQRLTCHYCDYSMPVSHTCPHCHSKQVKMVGYGTEKIEEQISQLFPLARVLRYDVDTTRKKNGHHRLLKEFEENKANVLVGTQMIAKGLDFPNVTFVGVLNADISLNIPDFRANERTFQLLEQVSGRSGRGSKQGTVMIQTYNPEHFVLQCVKEHDYQKFYQKEMKIRKLSHYPPFAHLVTLTIEGKDENEVKQSSQRIKTYLEKELTETVLGPAPCMIYRMSDEYRMRLMIKTTKSQMLYPVLSRVNDFYNKNKRKVRVICDFNPYTML